LIHLYLKRSCLLLLLLISFGSKGQIPVNFYQDSFNGGVTANGWSPDIGAAETGNFYINIYPGSTIRKAYLISGRVGQAADITVQLNSLNLTFNASTVVTPIFQISNYGGNSAVCAIDVTSQISALVNNYTLTVPAQPGPSDCYNDFYLYVAYNNASLPIVNTAIFLNNQNMADTMRFDSMALTYPYTYGANFGVSLFTGYECDQANDGEQIFFNSDSLGLTGGDNSNSGSCGETIGAFYYQSDTLFGLQGDNPNLYMNANDALSNTAPLLPMGCTKTNLISMMFTHGGPNYTSNDNNIWAVILAYGNTCVTMTPSNDTTVCYGSPANLNLSPYQSCYHYQWSPNSGLSNDTVPNPVATPSVTTTYTVIDTSGTCSATHQVVITVDTLPKLTVQPQTATLCLGQTIELTAAGASAYVWSPATGLGQTTGSIVMAAPSLTTAYTIAGSNSFGCNDTAKITLTVDSVPNSSFTSAVPSICNPLYLVFNNTSKNAATYLWNFGDGSTSSDQNPIHNYLKTGTYKISLTATSINGCSDSTFIINTLSENTAGLFAPNSFTPGIPGGNQLFKINAICNNPQDFIFSIYNRWGVKVFETNSPANGWDGTYNGKPEPLGVYVYYIKMGCASCSFTKKGNITLLR